MAWAHEHLRRARAQFRAEICLLSQRARRIPSIHPLRLQLEEDLATLAGQLSEIERQINASQRPRAERLAERAEADPARELPAWASSQSEEDGEGEEGAGKTIDSPPQRLHRRGRGTCETPAPQHASSVAVGGELDAPILKVAEVRGARLPIAPILKGLRLVGWPSQKMSNHRRQGEGGESPDSPAINRVCNVAASKWSQRLVAFARSHKLQQQLREANRKGLRKASSALRHLAVGCADRTIATLGSCRRAVSQALHRSVALVLQRVSAFARFLWRLMQTVGESLIELWALSCKASKRFADAARTAGGRGRLAVNRACRRVAAMVLQAVSAGSRLIQRSNEVVGAGWMDLSGRARRLPHRLAGLADAALDRGRLAAARSLHHARAATIQRIASSSLFAVRSMHEARAKCLEHSGSGRRVLSRLADRTGLALVRCRYVAARAVQRTISMAAPSISMGRRVKQHLSHRVRTKWGGLSVSGPHVVRELADHARAALVVHRAAVIRASWTLRALGFTQFRKLGVRLRAFLGRMGKTGENWTKALATGRPVLASAYGKATALCADGLAPVRRGFGKGVSATLNGAASLGVSLVPLKARARAKCVRFSRALRRLTLRVASEAIPALSAMRVRTTKAFHSSSSLVRRQMHALTARREARRREGAS